MTFEFDAYVTAAAFTRHGAAFALGDGTVRFEDGATVEAHGGAILCAAVHPSGDGLLTGGDDGKVVWSRRDGASVLAEVKDRWIDCITASPESGMIAFGAGKELRVIGEPGLLNVFTHEKSVADVAFDPKGRRVAAATYGGAALWYARIAEQKPLMLKWAGSHVALAFSPDAKFLMSAMQENQLHGWRLADSKDMRMGGYPAKVKSLVFMAKGQLMATSGAQGAVVWPFSGGAGPMGKQAAEVGVENVSIVVRVAAAPDGMILAAGLDDGRVWTSDLRKSGRDYLRAEKGAPISALAMSPDSKRVAFGDEEGHAGVAEIRV